MDDDIFLNSPALLDLVEKGMIITLTNRTEKFLYLYMWVLGHTGVEAAEVLGINTTNVSRHLKKMRHRLRHYKLGYTDDLSK